MVSRVTDSMLLRTALSDVGRQRVRLAEVQEKSSSGLDLNRPSDDPVRASAAILLRAGIDATEQYERNVSTARGRLAGLEGAIGDGYNVLVDARVIAVEAPTDTMNDEDRLILALEVESLYDSLLAAGNTRTDGSYSFAGFASETQPFVASGPFVAGLPSPTVSFAGDSNQVEIAIDEGITVDTTLDGQRVFLGDADGDGLVDAGAENAFQVLGDLRDALLSNDLTAIADMLPRIDVALEGFNAERSRVGLEGQKLNDWEGRLADQRVELKGRLSDAQDADVTEVLSDLVNQENALDVTLQATARVLQRSLLDFLR